MLENIIITKCPDCMCDEISNESWHKSHGQIYETRGFVCGYIVHYERIGDNLGESKKIQQCRHSDFYKDRKAKRLKLLDLLIRAVSASVSVDEEFKIQITNRLSSMKINT